MSHVLAAEQTLHQTGKVRQVAAQDVVDRYRFGVLHLDKVVTEFKASQKVVL